MITKFLLNKEQSRWNRTGPRSSPAQPNIKKNACITFFFRLNSSSAAAAAAAAACSSSLFFLFLFSSASDSAGTFFFLLIETSGPAVKSAPRLPFDKRPDLRSEANGISSSVLSRFFRPFLRPLPRPEGAWMAFTGLDSLPGSLLELVFFFFFLDRTLVCFLFSGSSEESSDSSDFDSFCFPRCPAAFFAPPLPRPRALPLPWPRPLPLGRFGEPSEDSDDSASLGVFLAWFLDDAFFNCRPRFFFEGGSSESCSDSDSDSSDSELDSFLLRACLCLTLTSSSGLTSGSGSCPRFLFCGAAFTSSSTASAASVGQKQPLKCLNKNTTYPAHSQLLCEGKKGTVLCTNKLAFAPFLIDFYHSTSVWN